MAKSKQGRAAKAARYRSAASGSAPPRGHHQNQNLVSHRFSMADEARNTSHNHADSDKVGKLRGLPVTFVCAGIVEPLKDLEALGASSGDHEHGGGQDGTDEASPKEEAAPFVIDTTGDHTLARRDHQVVRIRSPSLDGSPSGASDSGEDVILFRGRKGVQQREPRSAVVDQITIQVQTVEKTMQRISLESTDEGDQRDPSPSSPQPWQLRGHNDDDDLVADYIANIADDDDEEAEEAAVNQDTSRDTRSRYQVFSSTRDLGGSDGDFVIAGRESDSVDSTAREDKDEDKDNGEDNAYSDAEMPKGDEDAFPDAEYMDDEALALLLAKQEELGLDDDELVLFSGEALDVIPSSSKRGSPHPQGKSVTTPAKGKENIHSYRPSASAVADVFDELDLMDWDRHNPMRKPKSQRGQPNFDHLDPEMAATLEATWQKDRLRKKERKQAREELRAQGLLGKNVNPDDLRLKYPTGMTIDQIKEEMRSFLLGDEQLLTLPPMDSNARKTVHTLALKFNIKSKSTGSGDQRRPVLHRTGRTVRYRQVYFEEVFARRGRTYFHRMDVQRTQGTPRGGGAGGSSGRRGVNHAAFSYRDGEVVGGSAPELGQSNKGRNMLEKMGWSTGMALGATDNKGILQPVAHVVKRTKAGLG